MIEELNSGTFQSQIEAPKQLDKIKSLATLWTQSASVQLRL